MQHVVLRNRPTLSIGTERLVCLNNPMVCSWGPLPSTRQVLGLSCGPATRAFFFTLLSFLLREIGFFFFFPRTFPTKPKKVLGLLYTTGWVYYNPITLKSYKISQNLSPKPAGRGVAQSPYPIYRHGKACLFKHV